MQVHTDPMHCVLLQLGSHVLGLTNKRSKCCWVEPPPLGSCEMQLMAPHPSFKSPAQEPYTSLGSMNACLTFPTCQITPSWRPVATLQLMVPAS